ncbi:MAG: hypothetical protein AAB574_02815 [Patescibacteria group bacterium]
MAKHTKAFYRAIAGIRAVGNKGGAVFFHRLKSKLGLGYVRTVKLKDELVEAGVLRTWGKKDFKELSKREKVMGNIKWERLSKFRVPKEITKKEEFRVKEERKQGLL